MSTTKSMVTTPPSSTSSRGAVQHSPKSKTKNPIKLLPLFG